jgi:hypothetical protein
MASHPHEHLDPTVTVARRIGIAALVASVLLAARPAPAQSAGEVVAVLRYLRDPSASRCPDESALRGAVAARLGYDPFHAEAPLTIMVSITRAQRGLRARVWRESPNAPPSTPRTLESPHLDCAELAGVVALTVAIAVDPITAAGAQPSAAPSASSSPAPVSEGSSAPPEPSAAPRSAAAIEASPSPSPSSAPPRSGDSATIHPTVRVGILGSLGFQPIAAVGFSAAGGIRWRAYSLELEATATIPSAVTDANGVRARAGVFTGAIVPCAHVGWFAACGIVMVGAMRGEIENATPNSIATPFAAVGARAALNLRIAGPFRFYAHADVLAALTPTELRLDGATIWSSFPVSGTLGAGVAVHFR